MRSLIVDDVVMFVGMLMQQVRVCVRAQVRLMRLEMEVGNKILDSAIKESEMRCMHVAMMLQT